jgi:catechol 2,3-dioxygenase-like lactoylglutathione lyase family enzyme
MVELARSVFDIGLVVRDLEGALSFYRDKLGMTPTRQIPVDEETARRGGRPGRVPLHHHVGKGHSGRLR